MNRDKTKRSYALVQATRSGGAVGCKREGFARGMGQGRLSQVPWD